MVAERLQAAYVCGVVRERGLGLVMMRTRTTDLLRMLEKEEDRRPAKEGSEDTEKREWGGV